jgi:hypothetical protein
MGKHLAKTRKKTAAGRSVGSNTGTGSTASTEAGSASGSEEVSYHAGLLDMQHVDMDTDNVPLPGPSGDLVPDHELANDGDSTTSDTPEPSKSATTKKFDFFGMLTAEDTEDEGVNVSLRDIFVPVQMSVLSRLVQGLNCDHCGLQELYVMPVENLVLDGLAMKFITRCGACGAEFGSTYSSERLSSVAGEPPSKRAFEVNRRAVAAATDVGLGRNGLVRVCKMMGMPCLSKRGYESNQKEVEKSIADMDERILQHSVVIVRDVYRKLFSLGEDDIIDIAVSFDGSWLTRGRGGHSSLIGLGAVIEALTGLVVDFEVLLKYCHACALAKYRLGEDSEDFQKWHEDHLPQCSKNNDGSSNAMESTIAEILWKRSLGRKLRYKKRKNV